MGSAARHSSGRSAASVRARKGKRKTIRRKPARKIGPEWDVVLGALSDSLSIIITATRALVAAEERTGTATAADIGDEIVTLQEGVRNFRQWYDALDIALRHVRR